MRAALAVVAAVVAVATARPAQAERTLALAPLATLGAEASAAETRKVGTLLEGAFAGPGVKVVGTSAVVAAIKKAKKPHLRTCDGDVACLTELGTLLGATDVVFAELGGLGDAQVVYLTLVDVATAKETRATSLPLGESAVSGGPRGAAVRLLEPERYVGKLAFTVDVPAARVFVNGRSVGTSPLPPLTLPVGTHAVRVTHPEFRDFVRFVDVAFDTSTPVAVGLQAFPVIRTDVDQVLTADGRTVTYVESPWYRKWWFLAGAGGVLAIVSAITVGKLVDGLDPAPDHERGL